MILNETFAGNTFHFENARRAQSETPHTTQNQVVELQKAAIMSQQKAQIVPESKNQTGAASLKNKEEKEELISYTRKGLDKSNIMLSKGHVFDSTV